MKKIVTLVLVLIMLLGVCCARAESADAPQFSTFREAMEAAGGQFEVYGLSPERGAMIVQIDGQFYRAVTVLDEHARELNDAARESWGTENMNAAQDALFEYIMTLPVQYTERITAVPLGQEELDALAGKTLGEISAAPDRIVRLDPPEDAEPDRDVVFNLAYGLFEYELVINEPYEVFQEHQAGGNYDDLTVKSVKYVSISYTATYLQYRADGTWVPEEKPFENYDLMLEIADVLHDAWTDGEPDREARDAMIAALTEQYPEAADMIREMVESYTVSFP